MLGRFIYFAGIYLWDLSLLKVMHFDHTCFVFQNFKQESLNPTMGERRRDKRFIIKLGVRRGDIEFMTTPFSGEQNLINSYKFDHWDSIEPWWLSGLACQSVLIHQHPF